MKTPVRRALLSVSDKSGIVEFARALQQRGVQLLSTGGTYKLLKDSGLPAVEVSAHTGFPEIMDGRVKTLHPKIHGGLLGRAHRDGFRAASRPRKRQGARARGDNPPHYLGGFGGGGPAHGPGDGRCLGCPSLREAPRDEGRILTGK